MSQIKIAQLCIIKHTIHNSSHRLRIFKRVGHPKKLLHSYFIDS